MMDHPEVIKEIKDLTGIIRLNNPPQNRLLKPEFIQKNELEEWLKTNELKGLLITGVGRHFSAGADLGSIFTEEFQKNAESEMQRGKELIDYISSLNIPVICAINGVCFGGGLEIALASHIKVADPRALLAFPEVNQGLMPGLGGTVMITSALSRLDSVKMLLGGDMLNADEALAIKLIDHIVPDPENYSFNLLRKLTHDRPLKVIRSIMKAVSNAERMPRAEALREETRMFCELAREEGLRRKMNQ